MKTQFTKLEHITDGNLYANAVKTAGPKDQELSLHPILLISRLLYAVFVIGFMGYYFDRMVLSKLMRSDRGMPS